MQAVHYIQTTYYNKASRFTTNGFPRIQLAKGLSQNRVHSDVMGSMIDAKRSLDEES